MLAESFRTVLYGSVAAGVAVLVIILFRSAFGGRLPRLFSYALWAIVMIRLLVPLSFSSELSLFNVLPVPQAILPSSIGQPAELPGSEPAGQGQQAAIVVPDGGQDNKAVLPWQELAPEPGAGKGAGEQSASSLTNAAGAFPIKESPPPASGQPLSEGLMHSLALIWLSVAACLLAYGASAYIRVSRRLREAVLYRNEELFSRCRQLAGMNRQVSVYLSDRVSAPIVCGLLKPRIMLPPELAEPEAEAELEPILIHELVHVGRLDYLIKLAAWAALCVHWFNPLVWAAYFLSQKDMELACDEKVLSVYDRDIRKEYAASLIKLAAKQNALPKGGMPAFGESDIKSRMKSIMTFKKPALSLTAAAVILFAVLSAVLLTNGKSGANGGQDPNINQPVTASPAAGTEGPSPVPEGEPDEGQASASERALLVESLLEQIIEGGPLASSNPYDYVKDSQAFVKLVAIGPPALEVMLDEFARSNEDGLREYVMAIASAAIMGLDEEGAGIGTSSGREWYYKYGVFAETEGAFHSIDADYTRFFQIPDLPPYVVPEDTDTSNLEEVVASTALLVNRGSYLQGEKGIEAHKLLGTEEKDGFLYVYLQSSFYWFGFENGVFTPVSGSSVHPVRIQLRKQEDGRYEVLEYKQAMDIKIWNDVIRELFPAELAARVDDPQELEDIRKELWEQQTAQAREYLQQINRSDAPIADSVPKDQSDQEASRAIRRVTMMKPDFPDWNGTREVLVLTGGKAPGGVVRAALKTEYEKTGDGEYVVTLTRSWSITVNDVVPVSYWRYKVAGDKVELVEEHDADDAIRLIK